MQADSTLQNGLSPSIMTVLFFIALLFVPISGSPSVLVGPDTLEIRFVGNAGVELYDGESTILVDLPYQSGYSGYMDYDFSDILGRGNVVSAITHRHLDHFEPLLIQETSWFLFGPNEVSVSIPAARVLADSTAHFGAFLLSKIPTPHSDVEHNSLLIQWKNLKLYFVGDTDDTRKLDLQKDLDVLFTTPWLSCIAEENNSQHVARRTVLYHHFRNNRYGSCGAPEIIHQGESIFLTSR